MRPGPATRAALLGKMFCPCSTHEAWGSAASVTALRREQRTHAFSRSPLAKRTSRINLQHCGGRQPVLPCVEDSVRRPQRPGTSAPKRILEEPSWQFTLENYQEPPTLPQCSGRVYRTSRLNVTHSALRIAQHQEKSHASLCRNCGCQRFLVETAGKAGWNSFGADSCLERTLLFAALSEEIR